MTKHTFEMLYRLRDLGLSQDEALTLRRCAMTLHRWAELECGTDAGHIERNEQTGKPLFYNARATYLHVDDPRAWRVIPDRETGALRRVAKVCAAHGLHYYHQTDPRGASLYVSREPLTDSNYSSHGVAVYK